MATIHPMKAGIHSTEDAARLAKKRIPRLIFDFIEGSAGRETASLRNQREFDEIVLQPRVLEDVGTQSQSVEFLGRKYGHPFGIAPMGLCNLAWPGSDQAIAAAARDMNIPVCLSTAGSSALEEMMDWAGGNCWFQLYVGESVDRSFELVERAEAAGIETLILTVDVPLVAQRNRDLRNGFTVPFRLKPRHIIDFASKPKWLMATLLHGIPKFANFSADSNQKGFDRNESRTGANWSFLDRLRTKWKRNLVVKGVTSVQDACRIKNAGVDAIYVSNHGGRQLDSAPAAIECLPLIRRAVGSDYPLLFDSGIRNGEDIVRALAYGADFAMLGRPVLFALGANGNEGLNALLGKFREEIRIVLAQTGLSDIRSVSPDILFECPFDFEFESNATHVKSDSV